jgi:putative ABC transport system permease protein
MASLLFDLRDAVRGLRRDLGYALTVVLTLSLTIGAATAVFSIVDGVLLKPLAYGESQRLVSLRETWRQLSDRVSTLEVNEQHFEYWRQHARTFESMAQYIVLPANLTGVGDAAQVAVGRVSGSLFDVLQVRAALGRTLTPADEPSGRPEVAVISDASWRQRFGSDPRIVGRSLTLDGRTRTVVGVLRPDFQLPTARQASVAEAFVPIHMDAERVGWQGDHNNEAIGRLRDGATADQARAELDVLQRQVSEIATREAREPVTLASAVTPLTETVVGQSRRGLWLLLGAIAMVLLIACSNLANLSLTRAVGRGRDAGIRSALGASRSRLAARAAIEQLVLSSAGGALGLAVAWASLRLFVRTAPIELPRVAEVAIDARVLAFSAAVSILAGAAVAVLPAWRAARRDIEQTLRAGALTTTSDRAGIRVRAVLLASQVALSLTLLVVTGLLAASLTRLMRIDRGFVAERALLVPLSIPGNRYDSERIRQDAYDRLVAAMHALPGVTSATTMSAAPLSGSTQVNTVAPEGSRLPRSEQPSANFRFVGPEFFRTLGIAVQRGRPFTEADRGAGHVMPALISDRTAQRLWPGQDALGKRFSRAIPDEAGFEVVGIVGDVRITALDRTPPLMVYLPYWWRTRPALSLVIRTATEPRSLMPPVRRAIHAIDPEIAVGDARSLEQLVDASVAARRYQMRLFAVFGIVALFIATLGVYAVTAYGVSQRRREMNIRVALGARSRQVTAMVMWQGLAPIAAGVGAGIVLAIAIGGIVASLLFDVRPRDPAVIAGVAAIMAGAGVVACFIAALRGLRINPAAALREE